MIALQLTSVHPSTPTPKPDQIQQLQQRNAELEEELRALHSDMDLVDDEQKSQQDRLNELEDGVNAAHADIDELHGRLDTLNMTQKSSSSAQNLASLEAKIASLEGSLAAHKTTFDQFQAQISGQVSASCCSIESLTAEVTDLFENVYDAEGNNLVDVFAQLNEDFAEKQKAWAEWKESLSRRVSKLELGEEDDWVDAELKQPVDAENKP